MIQAVRKDSQAMLDIIEKKLGVLSDDLLKADLRDVGLEIIEECNRAINIAAIDEKIARFEEVDTASLRKASKLIEDSTSKTRTLKLNNQREIKVDDELTKFNEHLLAIEKNKKSFSRIEIALRLELALDMHLRNILMCLTDNSPPIPALVDLLESKLKTLPSNELGILWGRLKAEFQPPQFPGDGALETISGIVEETFFVVKDSKDIPHRLSEFIVRIRPQLIAKIWEKGPKSLPLILFGPARALSIQGKRVHEIPTTIDVAVERTVARLLWLWENTLGEDKNHFLQTLSLPKESRLSAGEDYTEASKSLANTKGRDALQLFILDLRQLVTFADRFVSQSTPVEQALMRFKLGKEVVGASKSESTLKKEVTLQRELCKFLLEQGVYSFGKTFGRNEIDLMASQPGETFIIEAKKITTSPTQSKIEKFMPQLQTYLDQEPSASRGILALFNYSTTLIMSPRIWIHGRYWVLAINVGAASASKTRKSIQIEESRHGKLISALAVD